MPRSKNLDGMDLPGNVFHAEELIFRFRCMPEQVGQEIMENPDHIQELTRAIQEYREFFGGQLGTEQATDDRLEELLRDAAARQPGITELFGEAMLRAQLQGEEEGDQVLASGSILEIIGASNHETGGGGPALPPQMEALQLDDRGSILENNNREIDQHTEPIPSDRQNLGPEDLRRILGDNDYDVHQEVGLVPPDGQNLTTEDLAGILGDDDYDIQVNRQNLDPEDLRRVLGDNDYDIHQEGGSVSANRQNLAPEDLERILGDNDYDIYQEVEAVPAERQNLDPEDLQRILGDDDFDDGTVTLPQNLDELDAEEIRRILGDNDFEDHQVDD